MQMDTAFAVPFMKRDDETLYDYCLSFSPAAPFFGVPWRFAATLKIAPGAILAPKAKTSAAPKAKVKIIAEPMKDAVVEPAAEPAAEAVESVAPVETDETVEAPAEAPAEVVAVETVAAVEAAVATPGEAAVEADAAAPEGLFAEAPAVIDDLKLIKGVGPKLEAELNAIGIYTFAQIAAMTQPQLVWIDEQISSVRGRPVRDNWAGQAKALVG
jgi:NADH-quinone oxidoreductase subunit E